MEEMTNEVVEETTEEIADAGLGKGKIAAATIGAAVLIGGSTILYKKVIKPAIAKAKAKKAKKAQSDVVDSEATEVDEDDAE